MNKGIIAFVIILLIFIVVAYHFTGFKFLTGGNKAPTTISTISTTSVPETTVSLPSYTTINSSATVQPCGAFQLIGQSYNTTYTTLCRSTGTTYGLWVAGGNSGSESVKILGADNKTYLNQSSTYRCITFFENWTGPPELYSVIFRTGPGTGSCGNAQIVMNGTTTPPTATTYNNIIYNGNFGNGEYTGWTVTGNGFGLTPLNLSYANGNSMCYYGQPWSNYNGTYVATTYNCGTSVAPGNLTSSLFQVNPAKPFLNFRIISPQDNFLYIEIVAQNNTPLLIAHFDTYNISRSINASSNFANVTIPLTQYINKVMRVKVVAISESSDYIAVGDFYLSNRPVQDSHLVANITALKG